MGAVAFKEHRLEIGNGDDSVSVYAVNSHELTPPMNWSLLRPESSDFARLPVNLLCLKVLSPPPSVPPPSLS